MRVRFVQGPTYYHILDEHYAKYVEQAYFLLKEVKDFSAALTLLSLRTGESEDYLAIAVTVANDMINLVPLKWTDWESRS